MADENIYGNQPVGAEEAERLGFCQDCGRPLTAATIRTVGSGVFCEPCLERRLAASAAATGAAQGFPQGSTPPAGQPNWQAVNAPYTAQPLPTSGEPSPVLAGFLGLIPGVGAMYNGQFAKGVIHLIVFAVLVSLADNVNGIFGLFVTGWVFFMAFEAYHTAKARRDGLPLPDPFGWNNIGERMGFGKSWPGSAPRPGGMAGTTGTPWAGPEVRQGPDWVGYVPPTEFPGAPPVTSSPFVATGSAPFSAPEIPVPPPPPAASNWSGPYQAPYQTPYQAGAEVPYAEVSGAPVVTETVATRRFPAGAIWLICLGCLFLIGNFSPSLHLSWRWLLPVLLAFLSLWIFARRMGWAGGNNHVYRTRGFSGVACGLRAPLMLMTLAILLALQSAYVFTLGQTWPVLLLAFGALLLLERTLGRTSSPVPDPATAPNYVVAGSAGIPDAGAWAATAGDAKGRQ